jgi:CheY-like chemotaxis protein
MKRPLILVVEDDPIVRDLTTRQLVLLGFDAIAVPCGEDAVEQHHDGIALILMDIGLPGMDGIQATLMIREKELREQRQRIPIVALTAADSTKRATAGIDDFLQKPALLADIKRTLAKWIQSQP